MRTGIIIRSTARGLATQSQEAWRGYDFDAALHVVDGNPLWPENLWTPHRRGDTHLAVLRDGELALDDVEEFLAKVDQVFSIETLYSWQFIRMLEHRSLRSIVQANCELWRYTQPSNHATKLVFPTPWRLPDSPDGPTIPVPVATECRATAGEIDAPLVVVHPAGHGAVGDRNGTNLVIDALHQIQTPVTVRMIGQDGPGTVIAERPLGLPDHVQLEICETGVKDRWSIYDGAHAALLPRRYGGLCLPAQEALQAGLAVIMTDCEPNRWWPIITVPATKGRGQRVPYGALETWQADPRFIARRIDELNWDRQLLVDERKRAAEWTQEHTWDALRPTYDELFNSRL